MTIHRCSAYVLLWAGVNLIGCEACGEDGDGGDGDGAGAMDNLWYYGVIISIMGSLCMNFGQVRAVLFFVC
jgi:hypothetical protein